MAGRIDRRRLLGGITASLSALLGGALLAPLAALFGRPLWRRGDGAAGDLLPVAELANLPADPTAPPLRARVVAAGRRDAWQRLDRSELGAVWLSRRGGEVAALSTICPHAGCFVDWDQAKGHFACPCHDSAFDRDGRCIAGPAPRAMDSLDVAVDDGRVLVRFRRFRPARAGKEPV